MFKSLICLATDVVKIAAAPVEIAVDLTRAATKPIADAAREVVAEVKSQTKG
jgi:hypothetical protein